MKIVYSTSEGCIINDDQYKVVLLKGKACLYNEGMKIHQADLSKPIEYYSLFELADIFRTMVDLADLSL